MNLTPAQLAALIASEVDHAKANPAVELQAITKRALRRIATQAAGMLYPDTLKWPRSIRRNAELRAEFLAACRIEELKGG